VTGSRLTVLGGSSPFTVALLNLLPQTGVWQVTLCGRNAENLEIVGAFGRGVMAQCGGTVHWTTNPAAALDGADIVLHQIRYGGLTGRANDECLASALGLSADETLGPSGLQSAIRMKRPLIEIARLLCARCPDAWVVNLTNPLSCSTAILAQAGVRRVLGVCELPTVTVREACEVLQLSEADVVWDYVGLNHRGFLHVIMSEGHDLLDDLPDRLGKRTIGHIGADVIAELHALPLKYFRLIKDASSDGVGRAAFLARLRVRILDELRDNPHRTPASLARRDMAWYPNAVIPTLSALVGGQSQPQTVNLVNEDSIAREIKVELTPDAAIPLPSYPASGAVRQWVDRFVENERLLLAAALNPSQPRICEALESDPLLPGSLTKQAAALIQAGLKWSL
jgi:6-phospho-beta-glucosidase